MDRVNVELPPAVTLLGVKLAVAPVGNPDAASAIGCGLPLVTALLITLEPPWPATTLTEDGEADSEKSFGGAAALNRATPAAQYMVLLRLAAMDCALVPGCTW